MTVQKDTAHNETKYIHQLADFKDKRVLEIGCGEGRLTWQYARAPHSTLGLDSDHQALRVARADSPHDLRSNIRFVCASAEHIPFAKETFDLAVLAWSL